MRDSQRDTDVQNSLLDSVGEGEGGMIWENGIETCKISYVKHNKTTATKKDTNEFIYKTEIGYQTSKTNLWLPKGKGGR